MEARRSRVAALLNLEYTPTPQQLLLEAGKTLSFAICGRKLAAAKLIALKIYRLRSGAGEAHFYGEYTLTPHVSLDSPSFAGSLRATAVKQFGEYNTLVQKLRVLHQDQLQTVTSWTFTPSPLLNFTGQYRRHAEGRGRRALSKRVHNQTLRLFSSWLGLLTSRKASWTSGH